jgi:hypothetical protein
MLLWDWWTTRNKANAGEKQRSTTEVSAVISKHVLDLSPDRPQSSPPVMIRQAWQLPDSGFIKINVDEAYKEDSGMGAWFFFFFFLRVGCLGFCCS